MLQKYQNEISPIIYYGISTKINEKDLKIPILQPPDWKSPYWMSLYDTTIPILFLLSVSTFLHTLKTLVPVFDQRA